MSVRDQLGRLNRLQHSFWFKVVASCVILLLAIGTGVSYVVYRTAVPYVELPESERPQEPAKDARLTPAQVDELKMAKARYEASEATARAYNDILARKADPTVVWVGLGIVSGLAIGVVWLGIGLTVLGVVLVFAGIVGPLWLLGRSWDAHQKVLQDSARFLAGLGVLALSFFILMELLKLLFSGPHPVIAIARNVVSEAVRMKVSIVFMVMLLLGLASLPGLLDDSTPLRYRVQSFLQYGTGGTFWIIAVLVLFLAVGSVAFEQRDRIIWQTMTKPVAPWQYLLGKWLGVVGIAAVLLTVTASGVFLFTGYLRNQVAGGEDAPYVARGTPVTEDRLVLETQVLAARIATKPVLPTLTQADEDNEVDKLIAKAKQGDTFFLDTPDVRDKLRMTVREDVRASYMTLGPGEQREFRFKGLEAVKANNRPMTLRYKVSVGADDPRQTTRVTFWLANMQPRVQEVPLGQALTIPISPASVEVLHPEPDPATGKIREGDVDETVLSIFITNGDLYQQANDPGNDNWKNKDSMSIPPDGLELSFPVGGYESNFVRVMIVLWLKLAFLAMVGVWAATYLSFAVASLIAFGTFLIAESAGFLSTSLEYFDTTNAKGETTIWKAIIRFISEPIAWTFKHYADLKPTANLVDGRMVDWTTVAVAAVVLGAFTGALYAIAVQIFRKRELATYSGQ